ncbi:MAG: hypothetical protein IT385_23530 [Deltaproteobacteria bacterium]|nr:hypothetical protein [Deltaproteobacteria bacterium]
MFWYFLFAGAAVSAILAITRGQNPLIWALTSVPGVPLLAIMPPANKKALPEQRRARRSVGDKLGLVTGGVVVGVALVLALIGIV